MFTQKLMNKFSACSFLFFISYTAFVFFYNYNGRSSTMYNAYYLKFLLKYVKAEMYYSKLYLKIE